MFTPRRLFMLTPAVSSLARWELNRLLGQFENCLGCCVQSLAKSSSSYSWCSLWSTVCQGLMLGLILFILHCICHDIKWRRLLDTLNCSFNSQAPLETWEPFSVLPILSNLPKCTQVSNNILYLQVSFFSKRNLIQTKYCLCSCTENSCASVYIIILYYINDKIRFPTSNQQLRI